MNKKALKESLEFLGYTQLWIDLGVLNEKILEEDVLKYKEEPYEYTKEHYRVFTVMTYLESLSELSDNKINDMLFIASKDNEITNYVLNFLLTFLRLTDKQFAKLCSCSLIAGSGYYSKTISKQLLRRKYLKSDKAEVPFEESLKEKYSDLQKQFLSDNVLSFQEIEILSIKGSNKAVRNIAKQRIKSMKT